VLWFLKPAVCHAKKLYTEFRLLVSNLAEAQVSSDAARVDDHD
jgi:hypothetical protein